jgi:ribonuclease P protein component
MFAVHQFPNEVGHARLGMAISAKLVRSAVRRNRIRRVIRETFRMHQHRLPAVDLFVVVRAAAAGCSNPDLVSHLLRLWHLSPLP